MKSYLSLAVVMIALLGVTSCGKDSNKKSGGGKGSFSSASTSPITADSVVIINFQQASVVIQSGGGSYYVHPSSPSGGAIQQMIYGQWPRPPISQTQYQVTYQVRITGYVYSMYSGMQQYPSQSGYLPLVVMSIVPY